MIEERIRDALRTEAAGAPDSSDLWAHTSRRIRRRRVVRWSGAAAGLLLVFVMGIATVAQLGAPQEVMVGEPAAPEGWRDVAVGGAVVAVPPEWQVHDLTGVQPDQIEPEEARDDAGEPLPGRSPCPDVDPGRPALLYSAGAVPAGCPDDPDTLTGLVLAPLDGPPPWFSPSVLEAGEPVTVGGEPARAVDAALLTASTPAGPAERAEEATTFIVPRLEVYVEVRPGGEPRAVEAVLETLQPREVADEDAVLQGVGVHGDPAADEVEHVGWAIDADGQFHTWWREQAAFADVGSHPWPAATAERFGAVVDVDGQLRVLTARADAAPSEYPLPADVGLDALGWSPDGAALAWLFHDPEPRLVVLDWGEPDHVVDGAEPERVEVAVAGVPDRAPLGLVWGPQEDRLEVVYPEGDVFAADAPRTPDGRLLLDDPLVFTREQTAGQQ